MTRLSARIEDAARDLAARINAGVLLCTDAEQTADLRALTCSLLAWSEECAALEETAIARILATGRGRLLPRGPVAQRRGA